MIDKYVIVAENRYLKERLPITYPMSKAEAESWKPSTIDKKHYRYFRIAKHKEKKTPSVKS
jgi:hypothetical protein